ncbi:MAG: NAD-dependent epimerase/dehydratase family protein [Methanobacteriota archaeon]|nr:MAG: NAD-dependent epimerase/dehydratase family protein [Euryarchaeota archaeon]
MQVAVLGARGLIGGAVVRRARLAGHQVRAVVRPGHGAPGFPAGIEVVPADLRVRESVVEAVRGIDIVVHAATVPYPEWPRVVPLLAENALAAAEAMGATLVFPGNVYVYGLPRSRFVTEDHPQEPDTVKGRVRLGVERRFLQAHQDGRVDLVLPRYPDVYGPGGMHEDLRPIFEGALTGKPCRWPLDADALHEFILNDDAAEAMLKLIGTPAAHGRAVHVPGPRPIVARDFIRLVYATAGSGEPSVRVVGRGMYRLVGLFNAMARSSYEMAYLFADPILLDGTLYRSLTGSRPPATPYEEGVPRTLEWFRSHRTTA